MSGPSVPGDPFRALRVEYLEGARSRATELPALAVSAVRDGEALAELRKVAHNLRGSGGFYGFHQISAAAAALEELTITAMEGAALPEGALLQAAEALAGAIRSSEVP